MTPQKSLDWIRLEDDSPFSVLSTVKLASPDEVACDCNADIYEGISSPVKRNEVATITEICYSDQDVVSEVDLVSLIQEQLPRYVLRADAVTNFAGYENSDWIIQTPCLPVDADLDLSPEVIEETLKYFVLSGDRLSQMTKTYDDIGAVTHLLEEKERDLELAARIGQKLLSDNSSLQTKVDALEEQLLHANDKIVELKHIVCVKSALLQAYVQECESPDSPTKDGGSASASMVSMAALQKKVKSLEEENILLKVESAQLSNETDDYEERETDLIHDCVRQLTETTERLQMLQDDLYTKTEVNVSLQDKITQLLTQIVALDKKINKLTSENAELERQVSMGLQTQRELVEEIMDWEERYGECYGLLQEAQEEIRALQKKQKPGVIRYHYTHMSPYISSDSLALELENSIRKNVDFPDGYSPDERKLHSLRVMRTANAVKKNRAISSAPPGWTSIREKPEDSDISTMSLTEDPGGSASGNSTRFEDESDAGSVRRCHSPESYMSTGSGSLCSDNLTRAFRIPEKLQIVKPMEGSLTLHQWQSLATPNLGGILKPRPGIQIKGEVGLDVFEEDPYSLSDYEEDDDFSPAFIKCLERTSSTYTFTMSKVTHPSEFYRSSSITSVCSTTVNTASTTVAFISSKPAVTSSPEIASSATICSSPTAKNPPSLVSSSTNQCTSTFSMSASLAHTLGERGISLEVCPEEETLESNSGSSSSWWSKLGFPRRFQSIVTETMCESTRSQTESLYTTSCKSAAEIPMDGLGLAEKIQKLGLDCATTDAQSSYLRRNVTRNPVDVGLNTIIKIKRSPRNYAASLGNKRDKRQDRGGVMLRRMPSVDFNNSSNITSVIEGVVHSVTATTNEESQSQSVKSLDFTGVVDKIESGPNGSSCESSLASESDAVAVVVSTLEVQACNGMSIPTILVNSQSVAAASALPSSFIPQLPGFPIARPMSLKLVPTWSQSSSKPLTAATCSSSSSLSGGPIVHSRVSILSDGANVTN